MGSTFLTRGQAKRPTLRASSPTSYRHRRRMLADAAARLRTQIVVLRRNDLREQHAVEADGVLRVRVYRVAEPFRDRRGGQIASFR